MKWGPGDDSKEVYKIKSSLTQMVKMFRYIGYIYPKASESTDIKFEFTI